MLRENSTIKWEDGDNSMENMGKAGQPDEKRGMFHEGCLSTVWHERYGRSVALWLAEWLLGSFGSC